MSGSSDIFVTKLNPAKFGVASLIYSTYLGGSSSEESYLEIAVDCNGNAYVGGATTSSNFPTKNAFDSTYNGGVDTFVTKLNAKGNGLLYSTYLGSTDTDDIRAIAVDKYGNAYVTGFTYSTNFPIKNAFDSNFVGNAEAFVTKLNPAKSGNTSLVYSSYLGGDSDDVGYGIAVDQAGNAYVTGYTYSTDFSIKNAFDSTFDGNQEAFLTKVNATGNTILYSTYLGGSGDDLGSGIAVDGAGNVYLTGQTNSNNFPTKNAFDSTVGGYDAFVTKLNSNVSGTASLVYSTYLGGSDYELGYSIAVDKSGNAYVVGSTASQDFPTKNAFDSTLGSNSDAFVTKLNTTGQNLIYSSYLGGDSSDEGYGIAVHQAGNAYVTGITSSSDFPTQNAFDSTLGGDIDAFVTKIAP
ncbi:SBBP repeat-containing protein [Nostoc sp. UHCC 0702]|nr:SBBP repeat-containing protein [Nostoc sp. UHCC 0702]